MIDPAVFICAPIDFQGICKIYPPTVREVITDPNFPFFQKILTITQEDLDDEAGKRGETNELNPFEFLLNCAYHNKELKVLIEDAFRLFLHEDVLLIFERKEILIGSVKKEILLVQDLSQFRLLKESDYFNFQNEIRRAIGEKPVKPPERINPNEDPRIAKIKQRARERDRIKAKQKPKDGIAFSTCLAAICCMGIGITPLNIGELSYASIGTIMNMMQEKEKYDIDIRSLLAGADSKKIKPKYWIRNTD